MYTMFSALIAARQFSTTTANLNSGLINFKKFEAFNKRWSRKHKKMVFKKFQQKSKEFPDAIIERYGTQPTGIYHASFFEHVPEKVPELVVPDLSECELRPYVSYATEDVFQDELTSQDLFNVIYGRKIIEDFKTNKLDADGNSVEPSALEEMSPDSAARLARQTGSDIFLGGEPYSKTFALKYPIGKR